MKQTLHLLAVIAVAVYLHRDSPAARSDTRDDSAVAVSAAVVPLRFHRFSDGLFVIGADSGYERWIGSRVARIGGTPVEQVLASLEEMASCDTRMGTRWVGPALLSFRATLEAVAGTAGSGPVSFTLDEASHTRHEVSVPTVPQRLLKSVPSPGCSPDPACAVPAPTTSGCVARQ